MSRASRARSNSSANRIRCAGLAVGWESGCTWRARTRNASRTLAWLAPRATRRIDLASSSVTPRP